MEQVLAVFRGADILKHAGDAGALRREIEEVLREGEDTVVVLDFAGVNGLSHGFVDELLAPLFDLLGEAMPDRVLLDNCSAAVLNDLKCVADMARPVAMAEHRREAGRGRRAA